MSTPLEKVKQLIALAVDAASTEEQSRTSAVIAARLIAKHGFEIVEKGGTGGARPAPGDSRTSGASQRNPWPPAPRPPPRDPWPPPGPWPRPPPPPPPPPTPSARTSGFKPRRAPRGHHSVAEVGRIPQKATHIGQCPYCGAFWQPGDYIAYVRGKRMTCMGCRDQP